MRAVPITERDQVAPEHHAAFDEVTATYNNRVVGPLRVLFYQPELARRISNIGATMRAASPFPAARELAIIAAAREWDCLYEWYAHEPGARRTEVSDASIDAVRHRRPTSGLPSSEATVISYVRSLLRHHRIPQAWFDRMVEQIGLPGVIELTTTIGFYQVFACVMNTFEVPGDAEIDMPVMPNMAALVDAAIEQAPYTGEQRVAGAAPGDASGEAREFAQQAQQRWGDGDRVVLGALLHLPLVARNAAIAREFIQQHLELRGDTRELATLAAARANASPYLWDEHLAPARDAGVSTSAIAAAAGDPSDAGVGDRQIVDFVRTLLRRNRVPEAEFEAMQTRLGRVALVELTAVVGFTSMMACIANAFELR